MLTIIHGSDTALSRKYFLDEKQKHQKIQSMSNILTKVSLGVNIVCIIDFFIN